MSGNRVPPPGTSTTEVSLNAGTIFDLNLAHGIGDVDAVADAAHRAARLSHLALLGLMGRIEDSMENDGDLRLVHEAVAAADMLSWRAAQLAAARR